MPGNINLQLNTELSFVLKNLYIYKFLSIVRNFISVVMSLFLLTEASFREIRSVTVTSSPPLMSFPVLDESSERSPDSLAVCHYACNNLFVK